ncbi:lamin tail domain-containing protein, partial [Ancylomarina longa]
MFLLISSISYGEDILSIDFSNNLNKGCWGSNSDLSGINNWTLDVSNCVLADDADYVKVVETSGGRMEAVDCDGEAIWRSKAIDISSYTNCSISILAAETGSSTSSSKYIKLSYIIDNKEEIPLSINGENIGNWGSLTASETGISGDTLVVIVRMNNSLSSNKVYFDDISIEGDLKPVERESLTEIREVAVPVSPQLINTKIDTPEEGISCFKFEIDETKQATDGKATKLRSMTFFDAHPENSLGWNSCIGGLTLYADGIEVKPTSISLGNDSIRFNFAEGILEISDGNKMEFDLHCYLNSKNALHEGDQIQFLIKDSAQGFETYTNGSDIRKDNPNFFSAVYSVQVEATKLIWASIPDTIMRKEYFSVAIGAKDEFGNQDIDNKDWVELSLYEGDDSLMTKLNSHQQLMEGKVLFDSLQYLNPDTILIAAQAKSLNTLVSNPIIVLNTEESFVEMTNWINQDTTFSSLKISKQDAKEVFRFVVKDAGKDSLSTYLKKIRIVPSKNNQLDWENSIAGFILMNDGAELNVNLNWTDKFLDITFPESENGYEIKNEDSLQYSIFAYLKSGETIDQQIFQMKIDATHQDWEIYPKGSGLSEIFPSDLTGPQFVSDVLATEMKFAEVPKAVDFQASFSIRVQLFDELGNQDLDSEDQLTLSLASGIGKITCQAGLIQGIYKGEYNWEDLIYSKAENFTVLVESKELESILSDNISGVDRSSRLESASVISITNLNSLATNPEVAVPVLNFTITDDGLHDKFPTVVKSMKFYKETTASTFEWKTHIAGAVLKYNGEIIATTDDVKENYIRFYASKGILTVPNHIQQTVQLCIYFRKSQLPDNEKIQVYIPKQGFDWDCLGNSSSFEDELEEDLKSEIFNIDTKASYVSFTSIPFCIKDSTELFGLQIEVIDEDHNRDENATGSLKLGLLQKDYRLDANSESWELKNGFLNIDSLKCNSTKPFSLCIQSDYISDTCTIYIGDDDCGINQDFENQSLEKWVNTEDWKISSYKAIDGNYVLKHNLTSQTGNSYISQLIPNWNPETGATQWNFILKNGDWDPSSSNYFLVHLAMDHSNPDSTQIRYSVGVNLNTSNDLLSLWKTKNDKSQVLITSDFDWNTNETVAVQINYTANGTWELRYNRLGDQNNWLLAGLKHSIIEARSEKWYTALQYTVGTYSVAGKLWLDNMKIQHVNTAPFLKSYETLNQDSILLSFSEPIDSLTSLKSGNFNLTNYLHEGIEIKEQKMISKNSIILILRDALRTGFYNLIFKNISDLDGAVLNTDSVSFEYFAPAHTYDVVINEIMADPSPSVGLLDYEYLELYNTKDYPIVITNWRLKFADKECLLGVDTIPSQGYILLCSTGAKESLTAYGKVLGVSNFPSLTNTGGNLEIESGIGEVIDQV